MWTRVCLPRRGCGPLTGNVRCLRRSTCLGGILHRVYFSTTPLRFSVGEDVLADENTDLLKHLERRGMVHTLTSRGIRGHLNKSACSVYSGVDPSAASLHVGNLLPLLTLAHFARWGHRPIVLVGGATGSIGDPSGRSTERNALDQETLRTNISGITAQLRRIFRNLEEYYAGIDGSTPGGEGSRTASTETGEEQGTQLGMRAILLNNYEWTSGLTLLDFLSTVGRQARMTTMLNRESVASRLNADQEKGKDAKSSSTGMSFTEFSYQLLQANDFAYLHKTHSCSMQIGGSDQLGNIMAGIDLIRRTSPDFREQPAYGLTTPLLTTSTGEKFGKSAGNAVWLDPEMTSDLDFYQFFLRTTDEDIERYLLTLTLLPLEQIRNVVRECKISRPARKARKAQRLLAVHLTTLIRGNEAAQKCESITEALYQAQIAATPKVEPPKKLGARTQAVHDDDSLQNLDLSLLEAEPGLVVPLSWTEIIKTHDLPKLLIQLFHVKSRTEAKRLLLNGAVYLNNRKIPANDVRNIVDVLVTERHLLTSLPPPSQDAPQEKQDKTLDEEATSEDESSAEVETGKSARKVFDPSVGPPRYFVLKLGRSGPQKIVKVLP